MLRVMETIAAADVCIVGAGAAGCVLAARLSEEPGRRVCLVEAGPDYGHHDAGSWPADLLDASDCATSHDWGYGVDTCCRVVGGSSAHNGCLVVRGTPADYDAWAAASGDDGWGATAVEPLLRRAEEAICTRRFADDEIGGWTRTALAGFAALGARRFADFNAADAIAGYATLSVNRRGRTRWSAAFAYLDPARSRPNLRIVAGALADRVEIRRGRAEGLVVRHGGREVRVEARTVVVTAGAYGSPAVLLRSGVGPAAELQPLGIPVVADLAGVGRGLVDHPCVMVRFRMREHLARALAADDARGALTHVQSKLKAASSWCPPGTFDLHVLPNVAWLTDAAGRRTGAHEVSLIPVLLSPRSPGSVRLRSRDPGVVPEIDRNLFADPEGHDLAVVLEGVELARAVAATAPVAEDVAGEVEPVLGGAQLAAHVRREAFTLYHPAATCAMGAVVGADGGVHGVAGLHVADAAALPTVPRANTHLSVLALAEGMAARLAAR
jgi:choline dehydrogenase